MFSRKRLKAHAKKSLKNHYFYFLTLLLFSGIIGSTNSVSVTALGMMNPADTAIPNVVEVGRSKIVSGFDNVYSELVFGKIKTAEKIAQDQLDEQTQNGKNIGGVEFGRSRGVFAMIINQISSGSILIVIQQAIISLFGSTDIANTIFIILSLFILVLVWIFFVNVYKVIYKRVFLEGRMYERVPINRLMFLFRVRKWIRASWTMFIATLCETLWVFTIVGGVIKHYSYCLVPYIIAENPGLNSKEAITLSRKMMDGHKFECFVLDLSFIGWDILGIITLGLAELFFVNPYKEATRAEYYVYVHNRSRERSVEGMEFLKDQYLYHKADVDTVKDAYKDILDIINCPKIEVCQKKGIAKFFADTFGIILYEDEDEIQYRESILLEHKKKMYEDVIALRVYPRRLDPTSETEKSSRLEFTEYYRHYAITTLILIFFICCIGGWLWEVLLGFINEGHFCNRGFFHGPWLPIYGAGCLLILTILYRLREKPVNLFLATIVLCGFLEYMTALVLDMTLHLKWWDYSGYFLNLHGRICAEGLLVFGIGGAAVVYFLAPLLDNMIQRIPRKISIILSIVLLVCFGMDVVYSAKSPNTGEGITDTKTLYVVEKGIQ